MVPPQQKEVLGVFYLIAEQQHYCLDRLLAPIHVVPQKEVVLVRRVPPVVEDLQQVLKLSVDVPHDLDGRLEL